MVANASQTVLRGVVVSVVDEQRAAYSSFLSFCPTLRFLQPHDDILHQHAGPPDTPRSCLLPSRRTRSPSPRSLTASHVSSDPPLDRCPPLCVASRSAPHSRPPSYSPAFHSHPLAYSSPASHSRPPTCSPPASHFHPPAYSPPPASHSHPPVPPSSSLPPPAAACDA